MKPDISVFRKSVKKINPLNAELNPICHLLALLGAHHILHVSRIRVKVSLKYAKNSDTLHEDMCTFMIISRRIFLRMRNFLDKLCTENQNTYFILNIFFSKIKPFMR